MESADRFVRRKKAREQQQDRRGLAVVVDQARVNEFLDAEADWASVQSIHEELDAKHEFEFDVAVNEGEVQELLDVLEKEFDDERFSRLLTSCRDEVLSAVVGPFGLGGMLARDAKGRENGQGAAQHRRLVYGDKVGGNVDTVHNVRVGTYATNGERQAYKNRGGYKSTGVPDRVHKKDKRYRERNKETSYQQKTAEGVKDAYTGKALKRNDNKHLDHVKSAKETHDDRGRILADLPTEDVANIPENLAPTDGTINRSKGKKPMEEFVEDLPRLKEQNRVEIETLEAKGSLTRDEETKLRKLKEKKEKYDAVDADMAMEADSNARRAQDREINRKYYTSGKFVKGTLVTGAAQGYKMGLQQAVGLVLCEFFKATFDEVQDIYAGGFSAGFEDGRFLAVLKERLSRVAARVAARWKDACAAFRDGFISGFLSNLATVIINMFVRTGKRIVRVIREGFFSLLRAIRILCVPPEGMTMAQAAHESSKLIAAGLVAIGGIVVEQQIDNMMKMAPLLEPLADILTVVLVGGLTGLATTFIVYAIDRMDLFEVNAQQRHDVVMDRLEASLDRMFAEGEALVGGLA